MERTAVDLQDEETPLISLCMIVKDEEHDLPLAIRSSAKLVDEVVIYDTGSTDNTVALARSLGATVLEGYWDDDFSRARNAALEHCHGRWILWLDADESLEGDLAGLRDRLMRDDDAVDAFVVPIESLEGTGLGGRLAFHAMRIFRRSSCQWSGALHEQIVDRSTGAIARGGWGSEVRILHRGYIASTQVDRGKIMRNLRIAEAALDDPATDRSTALFNYGRTLASADDPGRAIAPIREAIDTTDHPTVRRQALQSLVRLFLELGRLDEAIEAVEELRVHSTRQISVDLLEARARLYREEFERVLELADRIPFVDLDDDGFEGGQHLVAWMRSRAYAGLGRPSDAADALLDALRTHGILDEPLSALADLLVEADRPLDEIASNVRPECVAVISAAAAKLPLVQADLVLDGLHGRFPDRVEVLAAAGLIARALPIARALAWSARLRKRGLVDCCPVIEIAEQSGLEPIVRLRAAAAAYGTFGDERALSPARDALNALPSESRSTALTEISTISRALASLLEATKSTVAVHIHRRGHRLAGHRDYWPDLSREGNGQITLPFDSESVHAVVVDELFCALHADGAERLLDELYRVMIPEATLTIRVPSLEHAARRLLSDGDVDAASEVIYGDQDAPLPFRSGWTARHLERTLAEHGFVPAPVADAAMLEAIARRPRLEIRRSTGQDYPLSIVVLAGDDPARLRAFLEALSAVADATSFELVVVGDDPAPSVRDLAFRLEGDVSLALSPVPLCWSRAVTLGVSIAKAATALVCDPAIRLRPGAISALADKATDSCLAAWSVRILDPSGEVSSTGLELRRDASDESVSISLRSSSARGDSPAVTEPSDIDAPDWRCFALRTAHIQRIGGFHCGFEPTDAVADWALRARSTGEAVRYLPAACVEDTGSTVAHDRDGLHYRLSRRWRTSELVVSERPDWTRANLLPTGTLLDRVRAGSSGLSIGKPRRGGVNLVGCFEGHGYLSLRAERYRAMLERLEVPHAVVDYRDGRVISTSGGDPFCYDTTILCFDAEEMMPYLATVGVESMTGRFTIGTWHYPFVAPNSDTAPFALMTNELWVPSETARRAISKASTKAVLAAPPEITIPHHARGLSRKELGLPEGPLVTSIVDVGSGTPGEIARANPVGAVEAFLEAFPGPGGHRLLIRLAGSKPEAACEAVERAARGDRRVIVDPTPIDLGLEAATILNADCYLSLTRASAFDYPLAIALAAATPVIGVAHGGPEELLRFECAEKVAFSVTESDRRHLPYPVGTVWAEPDIDDAAQKLRSVFNDAERSARKAHWGALMMRDRHARPTADRFVIERLRAVFELEKSPENGPDSGRDEIPQLTLAPSR